MSNIDLHIPELVSKGALIDYRGSYDGGFGWRGDRSLSNVKYVVVHHTASSKTGNADSDIGKISREHITNRKWGGIGYHIVITSEEKDGYAKVGYVGDVGSIRAHAPNMKGAYNIPERQGNTYLLGIAVVGNFVDQNPTDAQLRSLHRVCYHLIYNDNAYKNLNSWDQLKSHKDFDSTSCPGNFPSYKAKIIAPPGISSGPTPGSFEYDLQKAKEWNENIKRAYGVNIVDRVDKGNMTREEFIIALHKFSIYIQESPYV